MDAPQSPFAVGRPLTANEPLFGREETFALIHAALGKFESVNLVGERRMGKTSFLNHLQDNPAHRPAPGTPPLLLVRVDLQNITDARRFYGLAIRGILTVLPDTVILPDSAALLQNLQHSPDADFDSFERLLRQLSDNSLGRPVLLVDEFEQLLESQHHAGFQVPQFYNGLRSLITATQLALVVASRLPLAEHFQRLPDAMTSTFPSYLSPQHLRNLDDAAADSLLL